MLIFDIEANGLLHNVTKIHTICLIDTNTGAEEEYGPDDIERAVLRLHGEEVCGHNILGYDLRVLKWFFPWFNPGKVWDTLILSRLLYFDLFGNDMKAAKKNRGIDPKFRGRHSLAAWGARLGHPKDDYEERCKAEGIDPWAEWNPMMQSYCMQDCRVTQSLWAFLKAREERWPQDAVTMEHRVGWIILRQWIQGVRFDTEEADKVISELQQKLSELNDRLQEYFPPWYAPNAPTVQQAQLTPKKGKPNSKTKGHGYVEGAPLTKIKRVVFNPGSRDHVANRLQKVYGWKPQQFGKDGKPTVDDDILRSLPLEPAGLLADYFQLKKHLGQLADGDKAYSRFVSGDGRIHGHVNTLGTRTYRMSHSEPNLGQVPTRDPVWGHRFRELFYATQGYHLVGCDAEGLEMRTFAHFTYPFDGGQFARMCIEGDKSEGTDQHTVNQKAIGLNSRDFAKTWFYGLVYGAQDPKLGEIIMQDMTPHQRKKLGDPSKKKLSHLGKRSREQIEQQVPGLVRFVESAKKAHKRGYLKGLDGRLIPSPSEKAAANTINQSAGAIIMKRALVIAYDLGRESFDDWEFVLNVHKPLWTINWVNSVEP